MQTAKPSERDLIVAWLLAKAERMRQFDLDLMLYGSLALETVAKELEHGAHLAVTQDR